MSILNAYEALHLAQKKYDLVTASRDTKVYLWRLKPDSSGGLEKNPEKDSLDVHTKDVRFTTFSSDGCFIITTSYDNTAIVWDVCKKKGEVILKHILMGHTNIVRWAAFSPLGEQGSQAKQECALPYNSPPYIVTASEDHTARLWSLKCGNELAVLGGHKGMVIKAIFNDSGDKILTISDDSTSHEIDSTARIWSVKVNDELLPLLKHDEDINAVSLTKDYIVTASNDASASIWSLKKGEFVKKLEGHNQPVLTAAFSPDSSYVLTTSRDGTARLWSIRTDESKILSEDNSSLVLDTCFINTQSEDLQIATSTSNGIITLWSVNQRDPLSVQRKRTFSIPENPPPPLYEKRLIKIACSADGKRLAVGTQNGKAWLWDIMKDTPIRELNNPDRTKKKYKSYIRSIAFSPRARKIDPLIVISYEGYDYKDKTKQFWVGVWLAKEGKHIKDLEAHKSVILSANFNLSGDKVITTSVDRTAIVWGWDNKKGTFSNLFKLTGHKDIICSAAFSPDGRWIATASGVKDYDKTPRLWSAKTGEEIYGFRGHTDRIGSLAFSCDGKQLVTGSIDHTARRWKIIPYSDDFVERVVDNLPQLIKIKFKEKRNN
jgi:WD40 repeat protein